MGKIGCIIMASGEGKRFGSNKLMVDLYGKPMIGHVIDATEDIFDSRIVVTRHTDVADYCKEREVECVVHDLPNRNDTVRVGLEAILLGEKEGEMEEFSNIFFIVGDQPFFRKSSIENMLETLKGNPECIVRAGFMDSVGSPIAFPRSLFEEIKNLPEKKGGRFIVEQHEDMVKVVQVSDLKELLDIDYREDLL